MSEKIISFFLASSIKDLEDDRVRIGDFIRQLNNIYKKSNIYIYLEMCESEDREHSMKIDGSQNELDKFIEESDLCFVIFCHSAGEYTKHEFDVAFEKFKKTNSPKIVVYFKKPDKDKKVGAEVAEFMRVVDEEKKYYHREYDHIDTLKLGIITQLQAHGFISSDLVVEDNSIKCDNKKIISTSEIPLFANNDKYNQLLTKYYNTIKECNTAQETYNQDKNNKQNYDALNEKIKEKEKLKKQIDALTKNIMNIGSRITSIATESETITDNIRKAIKLFDIGDYEGVIKVLNIEKIEKTLDTINVIDKDTLRVRIGCVQELCMRIDALKIMGEWQEVYDTYKKALEQAYYCDDMPKTVVFEYIEFLYEQKNFKEGIENCERLLYFYKYTRNKPSLENSARLYNLLGLLNFSTKNHKEATTFFKEALDIRRKLAKDNAKYLYLVAESCNNLAKLYFITNKHIEAEKLYKEAIAIYHNLEENKDIKVKIAMACKDLAALYYQVNRHEEAEKLFVDTLNAFRELADKSPQEYNSAVANSINKLTHLQCAIINHKKADKLFIEALKTRSNLAKKDESAFYVYLKNVLEKLAQIYKEKTYLDYSSKIQNVLVKLEDSIEKGKYPKYDDDEVVQTNFAYYNKVFDNNEIEKECVQALDIYRKLAEENPEAYEDNVAISYNNLAVFYTQTGLYEKAEDLYKEAICIQKKLIEFNPEFVKTALASSYCNIAFLYSQKGENENSKKYYMDAISLYKKFADKKAGAFDTDLARTYNAIANLHIKNNENDEANKYYFESIDMYIKLYLKSPKAYIDHLINTLYNVIYALSPNGVKDNMSSLIEL